MTSPLFPPMALAPLRAVIEAELVHVATLTTTSKTRVANGEYITTAVVVPDVPCLLADAGAHEAEVAAAQGVKAQWRLLLPLGTVVRPGTQASVKGETEGRAWTRAVVVTATDLPGEVCRACTAVDVGLNQ